MLQHERPEGTGTRESGHPVIFLRRVIESGSSGDVERVIANPVPPMFLASSHPHDDFSIKVLDARIVLWPIDTRQRKGLPRALDLALGKVQVCRVSGICHSAKYMFFFVYLSFPKRVLLIFFKYTLQMPCQIHSKIHI